jgi:hypothetical protein
MLWIDAMPSPVSPLFRRRGAGAIGRSTAV